MNEMEEKFNQVENPDSIEKNKGEKNPEKDKIEIDIEKLVESNVAEMDKETKDLSLKKTEKELDDSVDSVGINPDVKKEALEKNGIIKKLEDISKKSQDLFEKATKEMRILIVGMTKEEYDQKIEKTSEFDREKARTDQAESLKDKPEIRKELDDLKEHIDSQEYLNKLKIEFDGDLEKAEKTQKRRLVYLDFVKFSFSDKDNLSDSAIIKFINGIKELLDLRDENYQYVTMGNYNQFKREITLPKDKMAGMHEMLHASTEGDYDITEKARTMLIESYKAIGGEGIDAYLSNPSERLARKQLLDMEMERLGIKKYGDKFTQEHYEKMMKHYLIGDFSQDAEDFIQTTKPEYFEKIFDEIASNENKKSNFMEQS